jgi:Skp family chaperone for outer membrane proteins
VASSPRRELATTSIPLAATLRSRKSKPKVSHQIRLQTITTDVLSADASKLSAKVKSEVPGKEKEAEKKGEELAQRAGASLDKAVGLSERRSESINADREQTADAKAAYSDAAKKAQEYEKKAAADANKAIDKFDKEVTEKAAQAKSGISSWFGSK